MTKRFARAAALPFVGEEEVLLCFLPLYHTFGRYLEMLGMLFWGGTYVFAGNPSLDGLAAGLKEVEPTGPRLDPDPLGPAGGARPRGGGRGPVGRGRAGGAPDGRRAAASLGALGGRLPRAPGLPLLPGARRRALLGLRDDRGDGRHHDDAAGRVRGGLRRPPAPGHPGPPRRERRAGDRRALRRALPRRARGRRGRGALAEDGGRLPRAGKRAPRDRRPRQGHLQEQPRADGRAPPRRAALRGGAGNPPGLPRGRRKGRQRPPRRPRPRRPRPRGRPAGRGGPRLPPPDRRRREPRPRDVRTRRRLRRPPARLLARGGRADAEGLLPAEGDREGVRRRPRRPLPQPRRDPRGRRGEGGRPALALPRPRPPRRGPRPRRGAPRRPAPRALGRARARAPAARRSASGASPTAARGRGSTSGSSPGSRSSGSGTPSSPPSSP